ncbi:capsule assembly Wzi family protein [Melioribacter sp. OK-6-Me]|uniref:capsule assembly Wzi family protein n=1 Tax=unclassified Melioribacter TaxID=2627329 RepID=UPI003ED96D25
MKRKIVLLFLIALPLFSQQENVPLDHPVYIFLKEMKVKNLLDNIYEDNPNLSRKEVWNFLEKIREKKDQLSVTELGLLEKFTDEFDAMQSNSISLIDGAGLKGLFEDKVKNTFLYKDNNANLYIEILGRAMHGQLIEPKINNSELFDIGFRVRGTLFGKLGYSMTVQKGGVWGSSGKAPIFDPRLNYNFKFYENIENVSNYDFTEGYLRYDTEPAEGMDLSFQIGREKIRLGYGYGEPLVLTGNHPYVDFIRMNFHYGILNFYSLHGSTIGEFHEDRSLNYTKYIAYNKCTFSFPGLFDAGIGETVVYTGRSLDLAYLNPFAFYKFEEMSLQDRDNGILFLDLQTKFIRNLELQGTFFLDENILSHLQELNLYSNKTAYQLGAFWYSPLGLDDLSLIVEYTKIRPYVYSHITLKNSYTAHSQLLGHRIGPNSDELLLRTTYNVNRKLRFEAEYRYIRSGENIYDALGNLVFNAGGDPLVSHRQDIDPKYIDFLDGIRYGNDLVLLSIKYEPIRDFFFEMSYLYNSSKNMTDNRRNNNQHFYLKIYFDL